jgi:tRNA-modifying protein YgfZ
MADDALIGTTRGGITALTRFGLLQIAGSDAQAFLQGQLSCDVNALQTNQAVYGSYNNPKGRMLATFLLWRDDAGYVMKLPRELCESTRKRLSMYVLRSKVTIIDLTGRYSLLGIIGANALPDLTPFFAHLPATALTLTSARDARLLLLDTARLLIIAEREPAQALNDALSVQMPAISQDEWDRANILAGIPYVTPATQEQFVPQMANVDLINGVSFTKGCYPGQEIVARMHYLGKLKQRMYLAVIPAGETAQPGDKIYSPHTGEQATGMIVNAARMENGSWTALAVMHIDSYKSGDVHVKSPSGPRLSFLELPYPVPA